MLASTGRSSPGRPVLGPPGGIRAAGRAVPHPLWAHAPLVGPRDPSTGRVDRDGVRQPRRSFREVPDRPSEGRHVHHASIMRRDGGVSGDSCAFRVALTVSVEALIVSVRPGLRWRRAPEGQTCGLPALLALRGRRGSEVKGRAAIAKRRAAPLSSEGRPRTMRGATGDPYKGGHERPVAATRPAPPPPWPELCYELATRDIRQERSRS